MAVIEEEVSPPFVKSQKGTFYCPYDDLPKDIKNILPKENGSKTDFLNGKYEIRVWVAKDDGKVLTFVDEKKATSSATGGQKTFFKKKARVLEVQMLPITEANTILRADKDLEYIGTHSYDGHFYCECVKREGAPSLSSSTSGKSETVADIIRERDELRQALTKIQQSQFKPASEYEQFTNKDKVTEEPTKTW